MRFLSLNVAVFEKNNARLEDFLAGLNPDIAHFQEATRENDDTVDRGYISKHAIDAATPELRFSFFGTTWVTRDFTKRNFHGKADFHTDYGGFLEFGNYTRSRFPIASGKNVFLQNFLSYITDWSDWPGQDYRAALVCDITTPGNRIIRFINYHGIWTQDKQGNDATLKACRVIRDLALEVPYPAVISGDFNLFPETESIAVFRDGFRNLPDEFAIKTTRPDGHELNAASRNVIDYVFLKGNIDVRSFDVVDSHASDHLALVMDFDLPV